jgi:hypothetical protein
LEQNYQQLDFKSQQNESNKVEQLDHIMQQMFSLIKEQVEPICDKQTSIALRSYKSLSLNLLKSIKATKINKQ